MILYQVNGTYRNIPLKRLPWKNKDDC
jgi:hypothetical protein